MEKQTFLQLLDILKTVGKLKGNEHVDDWEKFDINWLSWILESSVNRAMATLWLHYKDV